MNKAASAIVLCCVICFCGRSAGMVLSAQAPADGSADARLRALYTEEWEWRQKEGLRGGGGSDQFPRVDAASQQARLAARAL